MSQRIFVVVGTKGGVGATTLAIRLAERFPTLGERLIVDADLSGKRSLAVWYDLGDDLDAARVIGSVTVVTPKTGPMVMELARTYEDGLIQTTASVTKAIAGLSEHALVVVDAPQPFAATVRPFINRATKFIVLTEPTQVGIGVCRSVLAAMERFSIPASRIALVLSDITGRGALARAEVERELRVPVSAELPNEKDRRFGALFDGLLTTLAAASLTAGGPDQMTEKPAFDRRGESGEVFV
jgi:MinD superfamily P-loop ATPase